VSIYSKEGKDGKEGRIPKLVESWGAAFRLRLPACLLPLLLLLLLLLLLHLVPSFFLPFSKSSPSSSDSSSSSNPHLPGSSCPSKYQIGSIVFLLLLLLLLLRIANSRISTYLNSSHLTPHIHLIGSEW
jgi:hypothetical protein